MVAITAQSQEPVQSPSHVEAPIEDLAEMKAHHQDPFAVDSRAAAHIRLIEVITEQERELVKQLRYVGYAGCFSCADETWDTYDDSPNAHVLLALDPENKPIGTIRTVDSRSGTLEVDAFTSGRHAKNFDPNTVFVESSRLVVAKDSAISRRTVQAALWKSVHRYALAQQLHQLIAWVKPGPDKAYQYLMFDKIEGASFDHPSLGNKHHEVYALDIVKSEETFRRVDHPLWKFFFSDRHENLIWY